MRQPAKTIRLTFKFGAKPIEFEKGKAGIVVSSKDKLPAVIDTLISAVRAGELTTGSTRLPRPDLSERRGKPLDTQHRAMRDRRPVPNLSRAHPDDVQPAPTIPPN